MRAQRTFLFGLFRTAFCFASSPLSPQCSSIPLRSISLTGLAALWKRPNKNLLMCEHNAPFYLAFSALLFAFMNIIPQKEQTAKYFRSLSGRYCLLALLSMGLSGWRILALERAPMDDCSASRIMYCIPYFASIILSLANSSPLASSNLCSRSST